MRSDSEAVAINVPGLEPVEKPEEVIYGLILRIRMALKPRLRVSSRGKISTVCGASAVLRCPAAQHLMSSPGFMQLILSWTLSIMLTECKTKSLGSVIKYAHV
jgi:hypothetical protein